MIFLHFSSPATLFPLQHNMAGPHFSVKHYVCHFIKLQMAFEMHFLCISFCGWGRFFLSRPGGPLCFIRRGEVRGGCRGCTTAFCGAGGALLLLALNLVLLLVLALSKSFSRSEERPRQLFLTLFPFVLHPVLKRPCLEVLSDQKTRISDMWQGHNAWMGQPK